MREKRAEAKKKMLLPKLGRMPRQIEQRYESSMKKKSRTSSSKILLDGASLRLSLLWLPITRETTRKQFDTDEILLFLLRVVVSGRCEKVKSEEKIAAGDV